MNKKLSTILVLLVLVTCGAVARERVYNAADLGVVPNTGKSQSAAMSAAIKTIRAAMGKGDRAVLRLTDGRYDFFPDDAAKCEYYISNHDQTKSKAVGLPIEDMHDFVLDGNGAELIFHGRMLPLSLVRSTKCSLRNFSIDFANPHISQITVVKNCKNCGITFSPAPWVKYEIKSGKFETYGTGWRFTHQYGMAFEEKSRHIVYNTSDLHCPISYVQKEGNGMLRAPRWNDDRLVPGTVIALRGWERPAPGIFMTHCRNTRIENVRVHYAEGMGLLAQLCEDIYMDGFGVCLRNSVDQRYFTTQADATHFSGCRGKITSINGLYEGMMDDAINVHGTYLKVVRRLDDYTLEGRYMHGQTWGFDWGFAGDKVQFVRSSTMEIVGETNSIVEISPLDAVSAARGAGMDGAKSFRIRFKKPVPKEITEQAGYGLENLTWTPEVRFAGNTIRNNRARGALFSTPRRVVVEDNLFDHTSGCAILLCGDCNGWYETGACRDVTIRRNRFVNALTSQFQFTNAVISIYPEIPNLSGQKQLFHGGKPGAIRIVNNTFTAFDAPILYAKSVDGLVFRNNTIYPSNEYKPYHWNTDRFFLQNVSNVEIDGLIYDRSGYILPELKFKTGGWVLP